MEKLCVLRSVYNRPEMLYLSIESEIKAREHCCLDYTTLFVVEYGADPKCLEIINQYPFVKEVIVRTFKHNGWGNILEGLKTIFLTTAIAAALNIEDDCILHKSYFKYIKKAFELAKIKGFSTISASRRHVPNTDPCLIKYMNLFEAPGSMISAYFFNKYVEPYATFDYYRNRPNIIDKINIRNNNDVRSKYRLDRNNTLTHVGWDGMVNRLIDTAIMEEGMYAISPFMDRQIHIGFYGQNRYGTFPATTKDFDERVSILRDLTSSAEKMQSLDSQYKDYVHFDPHLDVWDGVLRLA